MDFETRLKNELFCFLLEKDYDRIINIVKLEIAEREAAAISKHKASDDFKSGKELFKVF